MNPTPFLFHFNEALQPGMSQDFVNSVAVVNKMLRDKQGDSQQMYCEGKREGDIYTVILHRATPNDMLIIGWNLYKNILHVPQEFTAQV